MIKYIDMCYVVFEKLDDFSFAAIKKELTDIKSKVNAPEDLKAKDQIFAFQQRVIGELEYYQLPKTEHIIKRKVLDLIAEHETKYQLFDRTFNFMAPISESPQLEFERIWVNVQRAGDFIPLHQHSGIYSFVLWVNVPYLTEDQQHQSGNKVLTKDRTSQFEFVHVSPLGKLVNHGIPVDRTWEGVLAVFPAELHHQVYPFYNSDDLRISISGNIRLSHDSFKDPSKDEN